MERSHAAESEAAAGERRALSAGAAMPQRETAAEILAGRFDRRFAGGFAWYVNRLFRKRFHAVRLLASDREAFAAADGVEVPAVVAINHPGWWDPLVAFFLSRQLMPQRSTAAPMDSVQLRRFGFFRRIGVFGIDPDDPSSAAAMATYVGELFATDPSTALWITPQGRFTDVREALRIRPGAAQVAARAAARPAGVQVLVAAIEYGFWQDQRPEVFVAAARVAPPLAAGATRGSSVPATAATTADWHRAIAATLADTSARLAAAVIARDPAPFESLSGGDVARINPIYDLWLRLRGRQGKIEAHRRGSS